jgi:precorrin-6Y C5,15-methyltransferase (decarboxylating)
VSDLTRAHPIVEPVLEPVVEPDVEIVGTVGGEVFGRAARRAIDSADVIVASARHLNWFPATTAPRIEIELTGALPMLIEQIAEHRSQGRSVCVLSSGDPGFFGITRLLVARFSSVAVRVHPAPSSVSLAFAAAGMTWDDAAVVSAHGRDLETAVQSAMRSRKVAVLTAPTSPPQRLGASLIAAGCLERTVVVASRLGETDESVTHTDLAGLAAGVFDAMSVVILVAEPTRTSAVARNHARRVDIDAGPTISWGGDETGFARRTGMITKSEVRAVALSKLQLPRSGVMWDVGAGSGSVGVEAATMAPSLDVFAVERVAADAENITANATAAGVRVTVVVDEAPQALVSLPDPDRVFVGGGGIDVVRACWNRIRPGGTLVATFVVLDHAVVGFGLLGQMVQLHVDRCVRLAGAGVRLEPLNPVFVCWGRK